MATRAIQKAEESGGESMLWQHSGGNNSIFLAVMKMEEMMLGWQDTRHFNETEPKNAIVEEGIIPIVVATKAVAMKVTTSVSLLELVVVAPWSGRW